MWDDIPALGAPLAVAWRGHSLLAGVPDSRLSWHGAIANGTAADATQFIQHYIATVAARYAGDPLLLGWDVVNEAVSDSATGEMPLEWTLKPNNYQAVLNASFIRVAMAAARGAGVRTFYNDYRILWQRPKSDAVYHLLKSELESGQPIDGLGIQAHLVPEWVLPHDSSCDSEDWPSCTGAWDFRDCVDPDWGCAALLKPNLKRFADLGLELHVTELDVGCNFMSRFAAHGCLQPQSDAQRLLQARVYAVILQVVRRPPTHLPRQRRTRGRNGRTRPSARTTTHAHECTRTRTTPQTRAHTQLSLPDAL